MSDINKNANDTNLTVQDKCWELMSVLGMSWSETREMSDEDRDFLLTKVESIKAQIKRTAQTK
ncbi:hypothetical protein N9F18_01140 [bacterium]|jgi:hypothetical protein|nr:hypothetical protein [bacterium]